MKEKYLARAKHRKEMNRAKGIVLRSRKTTTSYLQRRMGIGWSHANELMEELSRAPGFGFVRRAREKRRSRRHFTRVFIKR